MGTRILNLCGEWKMFYLSHQDYMSAEKKYTSISDCDTTVYTATVPGNFELDLYHHGVIKDPYYGTNVLDLQKLENSHVFYSKEFYMNDNIHISDMSSEHEIVLDGIDTIADIYVNGVFYYQADNMFIGHRFKCILKDGPNEIFIHIKPVSIEARKYEIPVACHAMKYNYESLRIRKPAHTFGWDIMPRIVSAGIWKPVYIERVFKESISGTFIYIDHIDKESEEAFAFLHYSVDIRSASCTDYSICIKGICEDSSFYAEQILWFTTGRLQFQVPGLKPWWPKGKGNQSLYDIEITLKKNNTIVDTQRYNYGFRTVELINSEVLDDNKNGNNKDGKFYIKINGETVFVKGTNWVPSDAFHSRDASRISDILDLVDDIGCNTIRCWGGNVYEDDIFFDICDKKGFIVWQDFAMACGTYPQDTSMLNQLENEFTYIVKKLRNHPSLCIWAGDNECDYSYVTSSPKRNPNKNIITRQLIPKILFSHDPTRPYLPSSPYYSEKAVLSGKENNLTEDHLWGPRDYFKSDFYRNATACFASEIGYHGCPSPESIGKFISPEKIWPPYNNEEWLVHASSPETQHGPFLYRIGLMQQQIKNLFGYLPDNIDDFALMSQISQAEAMKFFIERFRIRMWKTSGIIWWNIIDGWPQFSDAVVDYYFCKKLAYHYIKKSQQDICFMMNNSDESIELFAVNDTKGSVKAAFSVEDCDSKQIILKGKIDIPETSSILVAAIPFEKKQNSFYKISWVIDGEMYVNHFTLSYSLLIDFDWYKSNIKKCSLIND